MMFILQEPDSKNNLRFEKKKLILIILSVAEEAVLGVEVLAQAIDSIITRVQVAFIDTTFRLEYVPTIAPRGLALEIKVRKLMRPKN